MIETIYFFSQYFKHHPYKNLAESKPNQKSFHHLIIIVNTMFIENGYVLTYLVLYSIRLSKIPQNKVMNLHLLNQITCRYIPTIEVNSSDKSTLDPPLTPDCFRES